jgi:hypothetical protein
MFDSLKKLLQWKWWWAVGVVLLVSITYSTCGSCTSDWRARYENEKGKYEAYRAIAGADARAMQERIEDQADVIKAQNVVIAERDAAIVSKSQQISTSVEKLTQLEAEYATLGTDQDAKILNLQSQVATLKANITLYQGVIADKDVQIDAWKNKYGASEKISGEWKQAYESEYNLRLMAEGLVTLCEKRLSRTLFVSKLKNIALVGLAGYATITILNQKG